MPVNHRPRLTGSSKYGFTRLFKGFFDLITVLLLTRFAERPSHAFGYVALGLFGAGFITGAVHLWQPASHFPFHLLAAIFLLGALVLLAAGWVAELLLAHGHRATSLPVYSIDEQLD